jgi:hypothetical protein
MIRTIRTYRTLPALLATLMVLGVGLPVLCQVCAPEAAAEHTAMHASHDSGHEAPAHCLHGHDGEAAHNAEAPHDMETCDDAACTMAAEEPAPAVQTERMGLAVHDTPALIHRAVALPDVAVLRSSVPVRSDRWADRHADIPLRFQTESFLL